MKFRLSTLLVVLALCCATMGLFVRNLWAVILALTIFFAVFLFAEDLSFRGQVNRAVGKKKEAIALFCHGLLFSSSE